MEFGSYLIQKNGLSVSGCLVNLVLFYADQRFSLRLPAVAWLGAITVPMNFEVDGELEPRLSRSWTDQPSLVDDHRLSGTAGVVERTHTLNAGKRRLGGTVLGRVFPCLEWLGWRVRRGLRAFAPGLGTHPPLLPPDLDQTD